MPDRKTSISILFICRGNICRSPMAEYILRDMVARDPVLSQDGIRISSAGTGENISVPASDQTVLVMMERGLKQIIQHKGQAINARTLSQADIILTMDEENKEAILSRFPD